MTDEATQKLPRAIGPWVLFAALVALGCVIFLPILKLPWTLFGYPWFVFVAIFVMAVAFYLAHVALARNETLKPILMGLGLAGCTAYYLGKVLFGGQALG